METCNEIRRRLSHLPLYKTTYEIFAKIQSTHRCLEIDCRSRRGSDEEALGCCGSSSWCCGWRWRLERLCRKGSKLRVRLSRILPVDAIRSTSNCSARVHTLRQVLASVYPRSNLRINRKKAKAERNIDEPAKSDRQCVVDSEGGERDKEWRTDGLTDGNAGRPRWWVR